MYLREFFLFPLLRDYFLATLVGTVIHIKSTVVHLGRVCAVSVNLNLPLPQYLKVNLT